MNVYDLFPTRFVTAGDLNGKSFTLTIRSVTLEDMQSHDQKTVTKPCLWFSNATKGMVLNKTNTTIIAGMYGPETDSWAGKRITIYATKVRAFGKLEEAVRVREEVPPTPPAASAQVEEPSGLDDDDDGLDFTLDPETGEIMDGDALFAPASRGKSPDDITPSQLLRLTKLMPQAYGADLGRLESKLAQDSSTGSVSRFSDLKAVEAQVLIGTLEAGIKHAANGKVHA